MGRHDAVPIPLAPGRETSTAAAGTGAFAERSARSYRTSGSPLPRSRPMLLQLARTTEPRGFRLVGEIDLSNVSTLSQALAREIEIGGDLTLDLAGLVFMDSTGIQVIIQTARQLEGRGRLILLEPGDLVR